MARIDEAYLYQRITDEIRLDILKGRLQPGDRLPSMRELTQRWNCTTGTIQRAYQELARQGLIVSQIGKGSFVAGQVLVRNREQVPLRQAGMVHHAEAFLLESITAGYDLQEIQRAIHTAMDRWRTLQVEAASLAESGKIRFAGSHDMMMIWLSDHIDEIIPGISLELNFTGSLGGLMALAEGKADLAGCHLWDVESDTYNTAFVAKLFPGKRMALLHLAEREIGLILFPGNPLGIQSIRDLAHPGVRFANRQSGSGTRVWLDTRLQGERIDASQIEGYTNEKATHSEVAQAIAEQQADAGIGLRSAAESFGLDFVALATERYDLVTYNWLSEREPVASFLRWLGSAEAREKVAGIPGYDFTGMGEKVVLDL